MKKVKISKRRSAIQKDLMSPKYRPRVIDTKKKFLDKKLKEKESSDEQN